MNNNDKRFHQKSYNHQQIQPDNLQKTIIPNNLTNNSTINHNVNPSIQPLNRVTIEFIVKPKLLGCVIGTKGSRIKEAKKSTGITKVQIDKLTGIVKIMGPDNTSVQKAKEFLDIDEEAKESTGITKIQIDNSTGKVKVMGPDNTSVQKAKEFLDIDEEVHPITPAQVNYLNRTKLMHVINNIRAKCKLIVARDDRQIESIVFIGPRDSLKIAGTLLITELKHINDMIQKDEEMRHKKMDFGTTKNQPVGGNHPNETKTQEKTQIFPQYISNRNIAKNNDNAESSNVICAGYNNSNKRRNNSKCKDNKVDSSTVESEAPFKIYNNSKVCSGVNAGESIDITSRSYKNKSNLIVKLESDQFTNRRRSANITTSSSSRVSTNEDNTSIRQTNNNNRPPNKKSNSLLYQDNITITANGDNTSMTSAEYNVTLDMFKYLEVSLKHYEIRNIYLNTENVDINMSYIS
eukprot:CAMPEP_0196768014 /NCGR_PEP_ID=MMETSP1095-20130614/42238_1 /TAXON_ID=96789 ORGANISM="Chromulina nebulosa, Strain UTEXLB2642" /NCGR_SAMPLE_ID=MMETSP1095 /ASSEMBLY_ACC=CAM_ASM_000446 /LENGTH=461 /DNA_ID=CAMNT_0042137005 /DNA_START=14 /DNA_END=1402 /DNA_ORIENTATION=-